MRYWIEVLFSIITFASVWTAKKIVNGVKKDLAEQATIKAALVALLHDRLYQASQRIIEDDVPINIHDFDNLRYIYDSYKALGGNGTGDTVFEMVRSRFQSQAEG